MYQAPDNNRTMAHFLSFRLDSEERARETKPGNKTSGSRKTPMVQEHAFPPSAETEAPTRARNPEAQVHTAAPPKPVPKCPCCLETGHRIALCEKFYLMAPLERRAFAATNNLCYICMHNDHSSQSCPNKTYRCGICGMRHHFLLHPPSNRAHVHQEQEADDLIDFQVMDTQHLSCGYQQSAENNSKSLSLEVALTYVTVWLTNPTTHKTLKVNLLADTGANTSCIDSGLGKELGLTGTKRPYHVQVGGGQVHSYHSLPSPGPHPGIQSDAEEYTIEFQVYTQPCGRLDPVDWSDCKRQWSHLRELDLPQAASHPVQGIIGTNDFLLLAPQAPAVTAGRHDPIAMRSRLGWLVGGQIVPQNRAANNLHVLFMNNDCCADTRKAMERMWLPETALAPQSAAPHKSELEKQAEEIFEKTQQQLDDGRYEVGLLWKSHVYLPNNFDSAKQAFFTLERHMDRHPDMRIQFNKTLSDWLNKNIVSYVPLYHSSVRYIIPTFMVVRLDKATTSFRLVVDGARRFNGTYINAKLLPGPKLIQNILDILIRFRQGVFALTCDINAMYLNVKVPEHDQDYLGLFYREQPNHPLRLVRLSQSSF